MPKEITIWFDSEGDFLEVLFEKKEGFFRETASDAVMEKVDLQGNIIGFSRPEGQRITGTTAVVSHSKQMR